MKTEKNRKLHGSVLLTVVFVMSILIVFLFGTMALALAANNRAHVNYSSAQTGITARAVAESAIKAIEDPTPAGKAYAKAIGELSAGDTAQVAVQLSNDSESLGSMGHVDDVVITYAGTKKFYDDKKEEWLERDLLKFTSNVTMAGVTTSSSVYVLKHDKDDSEGGGGGGAGFVTTADASLETQTSIWGGAYIALPKLAEAETYKYIDGSGNSNHEIFMSSIGDLIKPYDGTFNTALKGPNSGASIETNLYVCNNMYVENWSHFIYPDKSTGVTVWGDMIFHNNSPSHLKYIYSGPAYSTWNFNEIPYVYVDGKISGNVNLGFNKTVDNKSDVPLNIFCGSIETQTDSDSWLIGGNLYCMDSGKTSVLKANNNATLYAWTGDVINRYNTPAQKLDTVCGDVCSKGNLILDKVTVQGDVRVQGDCTIRNGVTINGDLVVGGKLTVTDEKPVVGGTLYINEYSDGTLEKFNIVEPKSVEKDNIEGHYYPYNYFEHMSIDEGGQVIYLMPNGEKLSWCKYFDIVTGLPNKYYVWNDAEGRNDEIEYTDYNIVYYTVKPDADLTDGIDPEEEIDYSIEPTIESETVFAEGSTDTFYYETRLVDPQFNAAGEYIDGTGTLEIADVNSRLTTPKFTFEYSTSRNENKTYAEYGDSAYPAYAEKSEIIGDNAGTKVVKRIEEVLKEVSNPYENEVDTTSGNMPTKIKELYNTIKDESYITDFSDSRITYDTSDSNHHIITIDKSCKLDLDVGNGNGKEVIIDPGNQDIVLLVKKLTLGAGIRGITVDDTKGGTVHMIIEGTVDVNKSPVLTTSYRKLYDEYAGQILKYNSSDSTPGTDITTIPGFKIKPNLNIYGTSSSYFKISSGFEPVSANVLSPDINVEFASSNSNPFAGFYYSNVDLNGLYAENRALFFGCLNSHSVTSANPIHVIYTTDGGKKTGSSEAIEDQFWYKIMYYSEF